MIPKFLLEAVDSVINKVDVKDIPFADISHHHDKNLTEGALHTWLNGTETDEQQYGYMRTLGHIRYGFLTKQHDSHEQLAQTHFNNLAPTQVKAIQTYISGGLADEETGSKRINNSLIDYHTTGKEGTRIFHFGRGNTQTSLNLDDLDSALKKNKLSKGLTTYSGLGFNPKELIKSDGLLHLPAYTSSSTNRGVATKYSKPIDGIGHILQIQHPRGSTGAYVGNHENAIFEHSEHISPCGITVKVDPTPDIHEDSWGHKLHVWKAKRLLSYEK